MPSHPSANQHTTGCTVRQISCLGYGLSRTTKLTSAGPGQNRCNLNFVWLNIDNVKIVIFDAKPGSNVDQPHGSIFSTGYPCRSAKSRSATTIVAGELVESQLQHEPGQVQGTTLASSVIGEELSPPAALRQSNTNCCNSCRKHHSPRSPQPIRRGSLCR